MSLTVYYFSGTGNSYSVARNIAERAPGSLVPIECVVSQDEIIPETDCFGIVYPVYNCDLPVIIEDFAARLRNISSRYIFVVATYGGGRGVSVEHLGELIEKNGGRIAAAYGIHMPQNAFRKFWEGHKPLYRTADKMVGRICRNTGERKTGLFTTNLVVDLLQRPINRWTVPAYEKFLIKTSNGSADEPKADMMYRLDVTLSVSDDCSGCGGCARVCPVGNIIMTDGKPVWTHHCVSCITCYNYCPKKAIRSTIIQKDYYYRHPEFPDLVRERMKRTEQVRSVRTNEQQKEK